MFFERAGSNPANGTEKLKDRMIVMQTEKGLWWFWMPDREKLIKWLEYDYLLRVGAYRKDCKQGCDACMPMHDSDDYCDIDMLCKILALLKEQEEEVKAAYRRGLETGRTMKWD